MFHYLYKITNLINNHYYYGVHSTEDINDGYMGSGLLLKKAIKKYGKENFKKEILEYFENEIDKYQRESEIITEKLINDPNCYNITLGGRGNKKDYRICKDKNNNTIIVHKDDLRLKTGELCIITAVKDKDGNTFACRIDDPNYLNHIYTSVAKGLVVVKDNQNKILCVPIDDPKYISGEYQYINKGKTVVKDNNGNNLQIDINNPDYKKYIPVSKNLIPVKDKDGNTFSISKFDSKWINGEVDAIRKNIFTAIDKNGNKFTAKKGDPRLKTGEIIGVTKGYMPCKNKITGEMVSIKLDEYNKHPEIYENRMKNKVTVKDKDGNTFSVFKDDPRYLSGELIRYTTGFVTAKDKDGNICYVTKDEFKNRKDLVGNKKDSIGVYDRITNKKYTVDKNNKDFLSGKLLMKFYYRNNKNIVQSLFTDDNLIKENNLKFCDNKYNRNKIQIIKELHLEQFYKI